MFSGTYFSPHFCEGSSLPALYFTHTSLDPSSLLFGHEQNETKSQPWIYETIHGWRKIKLELRSSVCGVRGQKVTSPVCSANISASSTFHPVTRRPPVAVSLRGNNNKGLLQYHYYHFGCLPATLQITLHGRQIANWNAGVMEANCLSAGLVCISCKSHVHSSETWLTKQNKQSPFWKQKGDWKSLCDTGRLLHSH